MSAALSILTFGGSGLAERLVVWIGDGHLRTHLLLPSLKLCPEIRRFLGFLLGQILLFARVLGEVVQLKLLVVVELDKLPVPVADGGARLPSGAVVVRIVPVEGARASIVSTELLDEALAVGVEFGAGGQAGEFEHGGEKVHTDDGLVGD